MALMALMLMVLSRFEKCVDACQACVNHPDQDSLVCDRKERERERENETEGARERESI